MRKKNVKRKYISFLALLLWCVACPLFSQSTNVPVDHWGYRFIDRLETKGLFVSEDFSTRPYTREAFADILAKITQNLQRASAPLSEAESDLFEQLKGEFYEELLQTQTKIPFREEEKEPHIFSWQTEELRAHFDFRFAEQLRMESREPADAGIPKSITSVGGGFRVNIKNSMTIFLDGVSSILSETDSLTNTVFNPSLGLPVTEKALVDVAITDNATSYVMLRSPWFDFEFGRDLVEWGPGFRGNLILSRNANVYDLLKLTFRYEKVKLEYFHAFLNAERSKYLTAHRIELRPSTSFQFSISESVVYGERSVEPLYLNPFIPFIIAERHVGNKDNNMVSVDATWFWREKRVKFYTELLFDDFSLAKNIFGSFGNKWAALAGVYWVDPFAIKNTDFRVEAVRIQPLVYTHIFQRNTYSNYNNPMGHWLGPDADDWFVELAHQPYRNWRFALSFEQRRRGQNDINDGEQPADGRTTFLGGKVERNRYYGLTGEWQLRRDWFLSANYQYIQSDNLRNEEQADQNNHRLFLRLALNY